MRSGGLGNIIILNKKVLILAMNNGPSNNQEEIKCYNLVKMSTYLINIIELHTVVLKLVDYTM